MGQINHVEGEDHAPEVREPGGYRHSDADIGRELRECLADDVGLDSRGIEVEVKNGEVTLSGSVRPNRKNPTARPPRWVSPDTSVDLAAHPVLVSRRGDAYYSPRDHADPRPYFPSRPPCRRRLPWHPDCR